MLRVISLIVSYNRIKLLFYLPISLFLFFPAFIFSSFIGNFERFFLKPIK